jgi:hypothetical protein
MKVKYGEAVANGLKYGIMPDRVAVYFVFMTAYMTMIFYPLYRMFGAIGSGNVGGILNWVGVMLVGLIVGILLLVWIDLALVRGYVTRNKKGSLWKAFGEVKGMYWRMVAVMLVVALISGLLGMIPYIGWIFSFVLGWIFLFVTQFVVIGKKKFGKVFSASWNNFKNNTGDTILTWLVSVLVVIGIMFVFLIPVLIIFLGKFMSFIVEENFEGMMSAMLAEPGVLILTGVIAMVGFAISGVFSIGMITDAYMQLHKKK